MTDMQVQPESPLQMLMGQQQEAPQEQQMSQPQGGLSAVRDNQPREANLNDPKLAEMVMPIVDDIVKEGIPLEVIDQMVNLLKFAVENPDSYSDVRNQLLNVGAIDPEDMPEQFDPKLVSVLLIAFKIVRDKVAEASGISQVVPEEGAPAGTPEIMLARGGLAKLASQGRRGDNRLAHINPLEDRILRAYGGSGAINPNTGLPEYGFLSSAWKSVKGVVKKVAPIALPVAMIAMPWLAPAIGTGLAGLVGAEIGLGTATMLGGAVLGGTASGLTGGNVLQGAALGGLAGGLAPALGGGVSDALGLGLSQTGSATLGGAIVGAGAGYATTGTAKGALTGAAIGGASSGVGEGLAGMTGTGSALSTGLGQAARATGAGLTAGYNPKQSALMGLTSGLMSGYNYNGDNISQYQKALGNKVPDESLLGVNTNLSAPSIEGMSKLPSTQPTGINYNPNNMGMSSQPNATFEPNDVFDDYYGTHQLSPQEIAQAQAEASQTRYANGQLGPNPGTVTTDEFGRTSTVGIDPKTGGMTNTQQAGTYALENGQVVFKPTQPELSLWDRATGALGMGTTPTAGDVSSGTPWGKYAMYGTAGLLGLKALQGAPKEAQEAVGQLDSSQQEYFNRPNQSWDWAKMQRDAASNNMSLSQFMARNWPNITSGSYNVGYAKGGALSQIANFATGAGSGRDDTIDARLSDGEYVIDAETVALLGDGSSKEGAKRLDAMRQQVRSHKGKALSKGDISPNAKSPLAYLKGAR